MKQRRSSKAARSQQSDIFIYQDEAGTTRVWPPVFAAPRGGPVWFRNLVPNTTAEVHLPAAFKPRSLSLPGGGGPGKTQVRGGAQNRAYGYKVDVTLARSVRGGSGSRRTLKAVGNSSPRIIVDP